ncbi:hypothetical protein [Nocardiopsis oceani]
MAAATLPFSNGLPHALPFTLPDALARPLPQRLASDNDDPGVGGALRPIPHRIYFRRLALSGSGFGFLFSLVFGAAALISSESDLSNYSGIAAASGVALLLVGLFTRTRGW